MARIDEHPDSNVVTRDTWDTPNTAEQTLQQLSTG